MIKGAFGLKVDVRRARILLGHAYSAGIAEAAEELRRLDQDLSRQVEAEAQSGDPSAQYEFGLHLLTGAFGRTPDERRAEELLRSAADAGVEEAQNELSRLVSERQTRQEREAHLLQEKARHDRLDQLREELNKYRDHARTSEKEVRAAEVQLEKVTRQAHQNAHIWENLGEDIRNDASIRAYTEESKQRDDDSLKDAKKGLLLAEARFNAAVGRAEDLSAEVECLEQGREWQEWMRSNRRSYEERERLSAQAQAVSTELYALRAKLVEAETKDAWLRSIVGDKASGHGDTWFVNQGISELEKVYSQLRRMK